MYLKRLDIGIFFKIEKSIMVVINESDDIYSLIRQNNTYAIRLWLDNITNDVHQRLFLRIY